MNREGELPSEDEQFEAYRGVVEAMRGLPVTIRTVDIGADKPLDRLSIHELRHEHALNPALGLRAIRWSLAEPGMFRQQLQAILRASALARCDCCCRWWLSSRRSSWHARRSNSGQAPVLMDAGVAFTDVELGAMIEVPGGRAGSCPACCASSTSYRSEPTTSFSTHWPSIDADEAVARLYDPWHPAVLQLIARTIEIANQAGKHVSVCGEMAGDAVFTELLLAMGLRSFSMHPSQIASVKQRIPPRRSQTDWGSPLAHAAERRPDAGLGRRSGPAVRSRATWG